MDAMNDERQAFEAWALSVGWHDRDLIRAHSGDYREWPTQKAWQGWRGAHERLTPCGCSIGTCESKPNRLCRMTVEIAERAELQAARAASPVPAGWKLVPVEPTEAMLLAGYDWTNELDCQGEFAGTKKIYAAMLAASPPAPPTPQPAAQPLAGWQPIETAPADTWVLLFSPHRHDTNPEHIETRIYHNTRAGTRHAWATHWMPLPAPPSQEGETR
jgi:hypothetical protein